MTMRRGRWLPFATVLMLALTLLPQVTSTHAQGGRTFPETGKTVSGRFLDYWNTHGGLAQQGYPITNTMQEVSDTDGKTYTVQYFERAAFELHTENAAPNDVLLSLLGNFLYKQKYPGGAPGQVPNTAAPSRLFIETNHRVGGLFLDYWNTHGGLAQQGYPISDEFQEVSDLDGKTYKVQYFERAVFEYHPENAALYNVLLSQLGTFRYKQKSVASGCDTSGNKNGGSDKSVIRAGESLRIRGSGFTSDEQLSYWITLPSGDVLGTPQPLDPGYIKVNPDGTIGPFQFDTDASFAQYPGHWALTFEGANSHNQAIIYFCLLP